MISYVICYYFCISRKCLERRKEFQHRFADSVIISVELRLYDDGCIELQYQRFPGPSFRAGAKIGIESRDGPPGSSGA